MERAAAYYSTCGQSNELLDIAWAYKALQLTDLTTLAGDDTPSNVRRLCIRAAYPITNDELKNIDSDLREKIHTAAVCVYPSRVRDAHEALTSMAVENKIQIAAGIHSTLRSNPLCKIVRSFIFSNSCYRIPVGPIFSENSFR